MSSKYTVVISSYEVPKPIVLFGDDLKELLPRVMSELQVAASGVVVLTEGEKEVPFPVISQAFSVQLSDGETLLVSLPKSKPLVNEKGIFEMP